MTLHANTLTPTVSFQETITHIYDTVVISYVPSITFISPFINHPITTLCILIHISVTAPTRFSVHWRHSYGDPSNSKSLATNQMIKAIFGRLLYDGSSSKSQTHNSGCAHYGGNFEDN